MSTPKITWSGLRKQVGLNKHTKKKGIKSQSEFVIELYYFVQRIENTRHNMYK